MVLTVVTLLLDRQLTGSYDTAKKTTMLLSKVVRAFTHITTISKY